MKSRKQTPGDSEQHMYTVMVTGGIGSGKSTLCDMLCERGAISIDLDEINRTLLSTNGAYVRDLANRFGEDILDETGCVITSELAQRAFADEQSTKDLNAISFPYITEVATDYILDVHCTPRSDAEVLVVEVPLLTEAPDLAKLADEIIAVSAPSDMRLSRAVQRGMDASDAIRRMSLQANDTEREAIADTVCKNAATLDELSAWVDAWWSERGFA